EESVQPDRGAHLTGGTHGLAPELAPTLHLSYPSAALLRDDPLNFGGKDGMLLNPLSYEGNDLRLGHSSFFGLKATHGCSFLGHSQVGDVGRQSIPVGLRYHDSRVKGG